jgi:adenylylsulfate kinase
MSGSGKSTIGRAVGEALQLRGLKVEVLDSGRIRQQLNRQLGFTREEIETNLVRLAYECRLLNRNGVTVIVTAVSPYRDVRERIRQGLAGMVEVYCRCPMNVLEERGSGELFERARSGKIAHVAGVNAPYEEPPNPEVLLDTDKLTVEEAVNSTLEVLEDIGHIRRVESACYSPDEEEMIRRRLQDLGYL